MSYASNPVKASIDWDTCSASTTWPVTMPLSDNVLAMNYSLSVINICFYYCVSKFIKIVVSVVLEVGKGFANFPTASSSKLSLYNPTVVT